MAGKELRHLRRSELVEIIYELQKNEARMNKAQQEANRQIESLRRENAELLTRCEAREFKQAQAGSIAEAMAGVSDIFRQSQALADEYLENVRRLQTQASETLSQADTQAKELLAQTEAEAARQRAELEQQLQQQQAEAVAQTEAEIDRRWTEFEQRLEQAVQAQEGLRGVLDYLREVPDAAQE